MATPLVELPSPVVQSASCHPATAATMYAIVDCNSFYCSCERLFRPDLWNRPVVVLSNNDGCIISRTDEAKRLGVEMAGPYFQAKPLIEKYGVTTFSSNYNLYGDMSRRVMDTLRHLVGAQRTEVYSVDEAFLDVSGLGTAGYRHLALHIRQTVERWTGISVSVGIAPTKVLSKMANHTAQKNKQGTQCVYVLDTPQAIQQALANTRVDELWGIGRRYAEKLNSWGIYDALQLSRMPESWARKHLGGIAGVRLMKELNGEPAIGLGDELVTKKMIATTRMFGKPVTTLQQVKEAVATYISRAAEKLRRQKSVASVITVFMVYKTAQLPGAHFRHGTSVSASVILPNATANTHELIKPALQIAEQLYQAGYIYKKAGVLLSGIIPADAPQGNLFVPKAPDANGRLMEMMDNINFSMRNDVLRFAAGGTVRNWKMRQEFRSPRYTARWKELPEVH
ncbi:Y-family DNA polymerase [Hydrotalea sp.]|uniref:Y-family DNA polymerase n=1 Tax=Hydrotalea sp. TaxID=2881279 RepID=UPI00261D3F6D|nr:Y-family DNA polymerase [Hydrotalea sp.]